MNRVLSERRDRTAIVASHMTESKQQEKLQHFANKDNPSEELLSASGSSDRYRANKLIRADNHVQ